MLRNHFYRIRFLIIGLSLICYANTGFAQTIHTSGSTIIGVCGDTITLRGIDYAPFDWGYDSTQLYLNQIAKTGANVVRMPWYDTSSAPYYTYPLLDTAINHCIQNKMIPVIVLMDITCDNDYHALLTLAQWYTTPQVTQIINKYKSSLIIDIANEAGYVTWDNDPTTALQTYKNTYDSITHLLRNANITIPIMIDAPDCGTNINVFDSVATNIVSSDPLHNVLFSAHAYWYAYANNDSATMLGILQNAKSANYPLMLGEIANYQDGNTACEYALNYTSLLHICQNLNIGWLAWSWNNDVCASRQLSNDGSFTNLSSYGNDIVNNSDYGLSTTAKLTTYLYNNQGSCVTTGIPLVSQSELCFIYYENGIAYLRSQSNVILQIQILDIMGRCVEKTTLDPGKNLLLAHENTIGLFLVRATSNNKTWSSKFIN